MDAEIAAHRSLNLGAVAHQHPGKRPKQLLALLQRGERIGQESGALALDDLLKFADRGGILARGRRALLGRHHARLLLLRWTAPTLRRSGLKGSLEDLEHLDRVPRIDGHRPLALERETDLLVEAWPRAVLRPDRLARLPTHQSSPPRFRLGAP